VAAFLGFMNLIFYMFKTAGVLYTQRFTTLWILHRAEKHRTLQDDVLRPY